MGQQQQKIIQMKNKNLKKKQEKKIIDYAINRQGIIHHSIEWLQRDSNRITTRPQLVW